ncbi:MAG: OB-fold nucleic acid binding domain-containing protein [Oscillospiraceae bacterium]
MTQSRTHTCDELRIENVGQKVKIVGWMENVREVGSNFAFVVVRDFYGTTQVVIEDEAMMAVVKGINRSPPSPLTARARARQQEPQAPDRRYRGRPREDRGPRQVPL